jgi:hypothetical protein
MLISSYGITNAKVNAQYLYLRGWQIECAPQETEYFLRKQLQPYDARMCRGQDEADVTIGAGKRTNFYAGTIRDVVVGE